jgi:hypothetical protein
MWKIGVVAAIGLAIAPAQAGHHRAAGAVSELTACIQVGNTLPPYIFPAPDWRPFFVKHMYVVGPVITCLPTGAPAVASEQVLSVKY